MAIFHLQIQIISRGKGGKSAVAAAAYRAGEKITNERDGITHDYIRKGGIVHTEVFLPEYAPREYLDRAVLWNEVERIEKSKNSQLARDIELSLPIELTIGQNIDFVCDYVKRHFIEKGMCADVCIHDKGDGNPHAHIMLTMRPINEDGTWDDKQRKVYLLDNSGNKTYDPKKRQYKCNKIQTTDWHDMTKAEEWRAAWSDAVNAVLKQQGHGTTIDHRSYERQGVDQLPTVHLGVAAFRMEQRGIRTDRGDMNRQIEVSNRELRQLRARIVKVKDWLFNAPLGTTPSLVDMMQNSAGGKRLETQWKRIANIKTQAKLLTFLTSNGIYNIEQLAAKVEQMHTRQYEVANRIKDLDRRKDKLAEHLANVDVYNQHLAAHRKYKNISDPKKQDAFFMKHEKEIEQYKAAYQYLKDHLNGRTAIPEKEWRAEFTALIAERYALCEEYYKLKDDVKSVEVLRRGAENIMNENAPERTQTRTKDISL